jgi:hypothetical protein
MKRDLIVALFGYSCMACALAADYSECKSLSVDKYQVAPHKEGFVAKSKDAYTYITKDSETKLFNQIPAIADIVRVTGTDDGRHVLFSRKDGVSIVNIASKKTIHYDLNGGVKSGNIQILDGYAYGMAATGDLIKLNINKQEKLAKPFDYKTHYWLSTWKANGGIYLLAQAGGPNSIEPAYALPVDATLNLGEKIANKARFSQQRDGALGGTIDDSGMLGSYGSEVWVVSLFEEKIIIKLPRYDYDRHDPYNGYVYALKRNRGGLSIFQFGSNQPLQHIADIAYIIAISKSGNEIIAGMKDDSVKMYCR